MIHGFRFLFDGGRIFGGLIFFVMFVAVITLLIVLFTKKNPGPAYTPYAPRPDAALDALKLRFAKGEITEEDYVKAKELINRN